MYNDDNNKKDIIGRECKFVVHIPAIEDKRKDAHYIKETIHYSDNTTESSTRLIFDFKRPFWITKKHFQNHKDKKEAENIDRLNEFSSTQSDLPKAIASRLGDSRYIAAKTLRDVSDSPYIYGATIDSRTIIKKMYMDKYVNIVSENKVCTLDIETDTVTNKIVIITISMRDKIFTVISKSILPKIPEEDIKKELDFLWTKYVPKTDITQSATREYMIVNTELDLILEVMKKAHIWKPDFMEVWNIGYDMNMMLNVLKKNNIKPEDVFSDPNIPKEYRMFKWVEADSSKVTASNKFKPLNNEDKWNYVQCPSSFYWIDGMSAHKAIRVGSKTVPGGYSLDNIIISEIGRKFKKLTFIDDEISNPLAPKVQKEPMIYLKGIQWHRYMLANKPLHYIVYNMWDNVSMIHLDDATGDLKLTIGMLADITSFDIFNSGPKKIVAALHFFYLENKMVLGVKPKTLPDVETLGLDDWIVLLPSSRIKENGLMVILENPNRHTNARGHTYDSDQVSGYPSNGQAANVSLDTTVKEIIDIYGIPKSLFKLQNMNIMFGSVNAGEYCRHMFNMPTYDELNKRIDDLLAA